MSERQNIFLVGPMGAGKSTIGRCLAAQLEMRFVDVDQAIEERTGADIGWIFELEGESGFRKREERILAELVQERPVVLATGGGAIVSSETRKRLSAHGLVVYLTTSIEKQLQRTQRDRKRPLIQASSISARERLTQLAAEREPLYASIADLTLATDTQSAKFVAQQIITWLRQR